MKQERARLISDMKKQDAIIKDNKEKVKLNRTLPYLVANVVEVRVLASRNAGVRHGLPPLCSCWTMKRRMMARTRQ